MSTHPGWQLTAVDLATAQAAWQRLELLGYQPTGWRMPADRECTWTFEVSPAVGAPPVEVHYAPALTQRLWRWEIRVYDSSLPGWKPYDQRITFRYPPDDDPRWQKILQQFNAALPSADPPYSSRKYLLGPDDFQVARPCLRFVN